MPLQNPMAVEERKHILSPQKCLDIFLHTNALISNLDKNYTFFHPGSQTHNYYIDPTTHFLGNPMSMTILFLLITKMKNYTPPSFTYNHVGDIFPMLW